MSNKVKCQRIAPDRRSACGRSGPYAEWGFDWGLTAPIPVCLDHAIMCLREGVLIGRLKQMDRLYKEMLIAPFREAQKKGKVKR